VCRKFPSGRKQGRSRGGGGGGENITFGIRRSEQVTNREIQGKDQGDQAKGGRGNAELESSS